MNCQFMADQSGFSMMRATLSFSTFYGLLACLSFGLASAQDLDSVMKSAQQGNDAARASQGRIDQVVDQTRDLAADYSAIMKEVDGLIVYNKLLEKQVKGQVDEMTQLDVSMDQVSVVERQVLPLMIRMIDGLDQFITLDVPFLPKERSKRLASLREMMERADVSASEKFRRVLESYQIENEYGRTIEAYKGSLDVDGVAREVDFLRVGRVGLYYQTLDLQYSGVWDKAAGSWTALGEEYRNSIRSGLRIARKETAPDLLTLPVAAAEG
jgi:hypothetical protein